MLCELSHSDLKAFQSKDRFVPEIEHNVDYSNFFEEFLLGNKPCKIKNLCVDWPSYKNWSKNGIPNYQYLLSKFGNTNVPVYDCDKKYFNSQKCETCKFSDFIVYWQNYAKSNYTEDALLYLKDWHLQQEKPEEHFYNVPLYFTSDWLNEYLVSSKMDDYRFVYMGPKGSWTPLHADVFNSFSWSSNICGRKRWIFFHPNDIEKLKDSSGNINAYEAQEIQEKIQHVIIEQNFGETIFVPSGWYHQVVNLEDTISINHNWINGCNVGKMWYALHENLKAVKREIEDCESMDDFLDHCQLMLKASFGMNFIGFYRFIESVINRRIDMLNGLVVLFGCGKLGKNHVLFDLKKAFEVLVLLSEHEDTNRLSDFKEINLDELILKIKTVLSKYI